MSNKLYKILQKEDECIKLLSKVNGTIEEKILMIDKSKISKLYTEIFLEYAELAENNIEVLKRSIFLIWFSRLEPFFITGMNFEPEIKQVNIIFKILDETIRKNKLDSEFRLMLNHYSKWDFIFLDFSVYKYVLNFITENNNLDLSKVSLSNMQNRGVMGSYWNSINQIRI